MDPKYEGLIVLLATLNLSKKNLLLLDQKTDKILESINSKLSNLAPPFPCSSLHPSPPLLRPA